MIQDPYNPYGINRFPRINRPRASSSGGIRAGAGSQLMGPQPGGRQGSGGGIAMGGSSTTTAPVQEQQQQGGALSGLLAGKETYDQITDAYEGGGKIRDAVSGFQPRMITDQLSALNPANIMRNKGLIPASTPTTMVNSGQSAFGAIPGAKAFEAVPTGAGGAIPGGAGSALGGSIGTTANGGSQAVSGLSKVPTSGTSALGSAAAGLGMGLSAYDMADNGINFGNATGLAGGAMLGASAGLFGAGAAATVGAMNAWNPVGWALLAGSAAYSIFG